MSAAPVSPKPPSSVSTPSAGALPWTDAVTIAKLSALALGFIALFAIFLWQQGRYSASSADWSHAFFVPLISGWLLWQKKDELARTPLTVFWPGMLGLLLACVCYAFFIFGVPNHLGQGLSFVLGVFSASLLLLGPTAMPILFFPIAYLVFGITLPEKIMTFVTYPLQDLAARGGFYTLRAVGYDLDLTGNVLHMILPNGKTHPLNVAEQCSGMRMVVGFVALSAAVALVAVRTWWKRVVLLVISVPVALLVNIIRVAVLGGVSMVNQDLATGEAHTWIGTLLLIPGFFLFMGVLKALNVAVPEPKRAKGAV